MLIETYGFVPFIADFVSIPSSESLLSVRSSERVVFREGFFMISKKSEFEIIIGTMHFFCV